MKKQKYSLLSKSKTRPILIMVFCLVLFACGQSQEGGVTTQEVADLATDNAIDQYQQVDGALIGKADNQGWRTHGRTYSEQRYSPIDQINTNNVDQLGLAWSFDFGVSRGIEATPIVHEGIIYVTSTWNLVYALDATDGSPIWSFDPKVDKQQAAKACCDAVNRGVAIWGDDVFTATIDGRLISLNARTGEVNWDINTIDKSKPYTITGAPRIVNGLVMIGNGGAELGVRGYVSAYDAQSGELRWRFYTVPANPEQGFENQAMEMAAKTWTGEYWQAGGGGTVWDSMAYDADLNLLYIGVGNGSPWNHKLRSPEGGDNLFLSSIVALKADTGDYVWHYQTTPADNWDYTAAQHMILADIEIEGRLRKVIMQAPKNGFFYVLDRTTGEFISANNFVPVTWATHIDQATGRPVETESARYQGRAPSIQLPGPLGAHNWQPMSYHPDTGLVYIPAQEAPWVYQEQQGYSYTEGRWNTGTDFIYGALPSDKATFKALKAALKGRLIAWDPIKQEAAWQHEHQGPWNGGVLSTAGNLVFQGTADAHFTAYNATNGEQVWKFFSQTGIVAAPISYQIDNIQYIAVAAGWGGSYVLGAGGPIPSGSRAKVGRLMVFKLGAKQTLPELPPLQAQLANPPTRLNLAPEVVMAGKQAYANVCGVCHGDQAYSSGLVPNLRYSSITKDPSAWRAIVLDGILADQGMPAYKNVLDEPTVEAIRAYVIEEANSDRDQAFYESLID